jgi:dienelactone hydrolase
MRRLFGRLLTLIAVISMGAPVSAQTIGVVLMHGNTDSPDGTIAPLAAAMEEAGYLVERPEMCWSHRRRRDRPFLECLAKLEAPIARLTSRGTRAIVVAGMSQGGALAFGARRSSLAGIIALAPNGAPERLVRLFPQVAESVAQARAMVAAGYGDQRASFTDLNIHGPFPVDTTAAIYLSFFDPAGLSTCSTT